MVKYLPFGQGNCLFLEARTTGFDVFLIFRKSSTLNMGAEFSENIGISGKFQAPIKIAQMRMTDFGYRMHPGLRHTALLNP
jgi:hypothetical protein